MTKLIIDDQPHKDVWQHLDDTTAYPKRHFTVALQRLLDEQKALFTWQQKWANHLGVRLNLDQNPVALEAFITELKLVSIDIPERSDGRIFSLAAQLREQFSYQGELRVTGDIALDQISFMKRCGINAFVLPDHLDLTTVVTAYQHHYQSGGPFDRSDKTLTDARYADLAPHSGQSRLSKKSTY